MFRAAAPGPYDEVVNKATDENLTSEDWATIIDVCDRVSGDPNGPKEVVQSMIKRLAHRNANVQLYTLELANALSQNCGKEMHRELSSRAFTDALLKLAGDRNTHTQVKAKILERAKEWSDMFKSDPDLGIMSDAYFRLKQSNPTLQPPSAPQKNSLTELDRQKEEEELQMALKLSLQEEERKKKAGEPSSGAGPAGAAATAGSSSSSSAAAAPLQPVPSGTTAATVSRVRALYDFVPSEPGELEFKKGDVIAVLESVYKDWWRGSLKGKTGIFPLNYVEKLTDPTPEELQREAQMEAEVFAEIKNVEKLLTLLSATNTAPREEDNEEISKLYHQTLAIRPKLIKLIEKYSQKKDDFTQLNEKFIKARRDYEALLESSMSHPPGPSYHQYAMRPQVPQAYPPPQGVPAAYPGQAPPPQDAQRYYQPAVPEQPQYPPPSSPSPNFQRPNATPAPFYVAGAEVPPPGVPLQASVPQPPHQQPPHHQSPPQQPQPPPQQHQQQQPQGYPQRSHAQHPPAGKQPAPIQTSPPPTNPQYPPYQNAASAQRPQSNYGPQELSTSAYDSPIAPPNPASAATYSSSVYSPDDPYGASPTVGGRPPGSAAPSAPSAAPPPVPGSAPPDPRPSYQPYAPYHHPHRHPSQPPQPSSGAYSHGYDGAGDAAYPSSAPADQAPHPGASQTRPDADLTPSPLQPGGHAYDARQTLPSRMGVGSPTPHAPEGGQPQYKAYVPPGSSTAPPPPRSDDGPSAPGDYYRTAAY